MYPLLSYIPSFSTLSPEGTKAPADFVFYVYHPLIGADSDLSQHSKPPSFPFLPPIYSSLSLSLSPLILYHTNAFYGRIGSSPSSSSYNNNSVS